MTVELIRETMGIPKLVRHLIEREFLALNAYPSCSGTLVDQGVTGVYAFDFFLQSVRIMELNVVVYLTHSVT